MRSSGIEVYDAYATNAIRLAAPYPPVPRIMARMKHPDAGATAGLRVGPPVPTLQVRARFRYGLAGPQIH